MSLIWKQTSVAAQQQAEDYIKQRDDAAAIAFVVLAEGGQIDQVTASEQSMLFADWQPNVSYTVGQLRRYNGVLYKCVQAHTSQADWTPDKSASLWSATSDSSDPWPAWSQPLGAHDAYQTGDQVSHKDHHWRSTVDANVWEPGVYGWDQVDD